MCGGGPTDSGKLVPLDRNKQKGNFTLAKKGQQGKLLKFRNNALRPFCSKYDMLAIELDFR